MPKVVISCAKPTEVTGGTAEIRKERLREIAKKRHLPGRPKMGRDELARKLGEK
jgi:hypothetical protein